MLGRVLFLAYSWSISKSYYTRTAPKYILLVQFLSHKESYQVQSPDWGCLNYWFSLFYILPFLQSSWFLVFYLTIYPISHVGWPWWAVCCNLSFIVSCVCSILHLALTFRSTTSFQTFPTLTMFLWPWTGSGCLHVCTIYCSGKPSQSQLLTLQTPLLLASSFPEGTGESGEGGVYSRAKTSSAVRKWSEICYENFRMSFLAPHLQAFPFSCLSFQTYLKRKGWNFQLALVS